MMYINIVYVCIALYAPHVPLQQFIIDDDDSNILAGRSRDHYYYTKTREKLKCFRATVLTRDVYMAILLLSYKVTDVKQSDTPFAPRRNMARSTSPRLYLYPYSRVLIRRRSPF